MRQEVFDMLTWDDEVTPILKPTTASPPPAAPLAGVVAAQPPLTSQALHTTAALAVKATLGRRVNAADKRIINGQTDVNQLVPFKYKWAW